jgi:hypothetical protein
MKQEQKERFKKAVQRYGSSTGVWFSRSISMWFYPENTHGIAFVHPELVDEAEEYQPFVESITFDLLEPEKSKVNITSNRWNPNDPSEEHLLDEFDEAGINELLEMIEEREI